MKKNNIVLLVFAVVLFISLFRLGATTLFDVDEAVFSEATKEMVESGDWITPTYNGEVRYDKPIFFYWAMGLSYKAFGINEFGARFPSALAGCLLSVAVFFFVKRCIDTTKALYAVLSFAVSGYFLVYSRAAVTDMVLALFISLSLFSFYISVTEDRRYIYGTYFFSALALLTKGLIGIVFPFGVAIVYLLVTDGFGGLKKVFSIKAALLFLIVAAPWYALQFSIHGEEFFQQFFMKHHFKRYTDVISGHKGPFYFYLVALVIGLFPWITFLPAGIRKALKDRDKLHIFACIWAALIVIFFSLSTTKLPNYILPSLPAISILIASGMAEQGFRWGRSSMGFIAIITLLAGIGIAIVPSYLVDFGITETGWMYAGAAMVLTMAGLSFYSVFTKQTVYGMMLCIMVVFFALVLVKAVPLASEQLQGTLYRYSLYAKDKARADERIICYGINFPSIVFYSGHKVANVRGQDALQSYMKEKGDRIAIAKTKDIEVLKDAGFTVLQKDKRYALLERK